MFKGLQPKSSSRAQLFAILLLPAHYQNEGAAAGDAVSSVPKDHGTGLSLVVCHYDAGRPKATTPGTGWEKHHAHFSRRSLINYLARHELGTTTIAKMKCAQQGNTSSFSS